MAAATEPLAIDLEHVAKTYRRRVHALRGVRLAVRSGEVFGLLGPNGAGKSTLVKILMTVVRPSRAKGTVLGRPLGHKPTLAQVGYLPENHQLPGYLTARQALEYYAALAKVDRRTRRRRSLELLELVGLAQWAGHKVSTFSKGMQQRLGLAQALMNDPDLIVLDEPTDGLDPMGRRDTRLLLEKLRREGKTVFLNSHLLGDVERVCDRVAILRAGQVVRQGTIDELTAGTCRYEIELDGPVRELHTAVAEALGCTLKQVDAPILVDSPGASDGPAPALAKGSLKSGESVELEGSLLRIGTDDAVAVQPILDALRRRQLVIISVGPVRQSLEDYFVQAVSEAADAESGAKGATS
jgi:ABC-2 type transport system ATP-binding protein